MEGKGYILYPKTPEQSARKRLYRREELELMTAHQLREICRNEKIVRGIADPLDKEELIHEIMRYHGMRDHLIIKEADQQGMDRLEDYFGKAKFQFQTDARMQIASKIIIHENRSLGFHDDISIPWQGELEGTNALIVSGGTKICGLFYLSAFGNRQDKLYLLKYPGLPCEMSPVKNYELYCFRRKESEALYDIYCGRAKNVPTAISAYKTALIDLEVCQPIPLRIPLAIDFGSTNTTAGVYLDTRYFEQAGPGAYLKGMRADSIQYTGFYERQPEKGAGEDLEERQLLPSVAGIVSVKDNQPEYVFGYEALRLASLSYIDEGFCCFHDIKRWIVDYEKEEAVTDRQGRRGLIKRKDILKAFFDYIVRETENRFKCRVDKIHISCPVKQKYLFQKLFEDILPGQALPFEGTVDEGVSVLYNTISDLLESRQLEEGHPYQALIMDCGGGTTDLCICRFKIWNQKISYHIEVETAYENGDTDFGGNNLTYRIMQLLKIAAARALGGSQLPKVGTIMAGWDQDLFRFVDRHGTGELYRQLEEAYQGAEDFLPTRYKDYETQSRTDYYKVRNNFYFFFYMAEQVKKRLYEKSGVSKVIISSTDPQARKNSGLPLYYQNISLKEPGSQEDAAIEGATEWIPADKWKVSVRKPGGLQVVKEFPELALGMPAVSLLLKGDVYGIVRKFMYPLYEDGRADQFSFLKLTGQSCKIPVFREALTEFIPGMMIQFKRQSNEGEGDAELKMSCVDGALKYLRDKYLGYAKVTIHSDKPVLPYRVTALTHSGQEVELLNGFFREDAARTISRNLDQVTLKLFLKDTEGKVRYSFHYDCLPEEFQQVTYEQIAERHGHYIQQKETDSIVNGEIRFFAWKRFEEWGYVIAPVFRREDRLHLGREQFYSFENEGWVTNFFDGLR